MMMVPNIATKLLLLYIILAVNTDNLLALHSTSELARNILGRIQSHFQQTTPNRSEGRMHGGCTDSFSIFGFLAFLLALLNLILELQARDMLNIGRRIKRGTSDDLFALHCQEDIKMQEAASACYSLLRGFLNALSTQDTNCAQRFMCEAAEEAKGMGKLGAVVARVASQNAGTWLHTVHPLQYKGVMEAGKMGATEGGCVIRYTQCYTLPDSYRHPAVYHGRHHPPEMYRQVLDEVMDFVRENLL